MWKSAASILTILVFAAQNLYSQVSLPVDDLFLCGKIYIVHADNPEAKEKDEAFPDAAKEIKKALKKRAYWLKRKQQTVYISKTAGQAKTGCFTFHIGSESAGFFEKASFSATGGVLVIEDRNYELSGISCCIRSYDDSIFASLNCPAGDMFSLEPGGYIVRGEKGIIEKGAFSSDGVNKFILAEKIEQVNLLEVTGEKDNVFQYSGKNKRFEKAVSLFLNRDHKEARALFEQMLTEEPGNPFAMTYLARIYFRNGEYEKSLSHSGASLPWAFLNRGRSLIMLGRYQEGEEVLCHIVNSLAKKQYGDETEPVKRIASFWLKKPYLTTEEFVNQNTSAFVQGSLKEKEKLISEMKRKLALDPGNSGLHYGLGYLYWFSGNVPHAIRNEAELAELLASTDDELAKAKMLRILSLFSAIEDLWNTMLNEDTIVMIKAQDKAFRREINRLASELMRLKISDDAKNEIRRVAGMIK